MEFRALCIEFILCSAKNMQHWMELGSALCKASTFSSVLSLAHQIRFFWSRRNEDIGLGMYKQAGMKKYYSAGRLS